ncbi:MAG TPA: alpha/beta fold hydrolase [Stellaceae bacterium]|nr:alpha/beta fold hydrolase [Stellaceae bacterium]
MAAVELAATEQGSGPPLLILHGVFGSGRNWSSLAQHLAAAHHVFALDARNHGASPWADSMSYADMIADVRAFQAARGLERVAVMGHSMGGKTAMLLALSRPEAVERLVVVDVAPVAYQPALAAYVQAMRAADLAGVSRRAQVDAQLAGAIASPGERAFLLQNLVLEGGQARWRLNLPVLERFMPEISGFPELAQGVAFAGPALFIAGERSGYVRPEHGPVIERLFPKARIVQVPEAGHWLHAERPDAFLALVTPFLAGAG